LHTQTAGDNTVIVDSTDDFAGMCRNLGFSLSLYSGQMCTTPQNVLIPRDGIETADGHRSFAEVAQGIADAVGKLTGDDARAVELTGAIVNDAVVSQDRKSTRLNSSHLGISYAVFCLKKKK